MRTFLFVGLLVVSVGCKKHLPTDPVATDLPPPAEPAKPPAPAPVLALARNFERVQFAYDSAEVDAVSKAALQENAAILLATPDLRIEIQGHADERGSTEYNLALGQKRAAAVRSWLQAQGVAASRLTTLSYGEERPLDASPSETAWAVNRRAEFRITWAADALVEGTVR